VSYFPVKLSESDRQIILGALDSLGIALAEHDHEWSVGEPTIYEEQPMLSPKSWKTSKQRLPCTTLITIS
jgi:hypothetical protein